MRSINCIFGGASWTAVPWAIRYWWILVCHHCYLFFLCPFPSKVQIIYIFSVKELFYAVWRVTCFISPQQIILRASYFNPYYLQILIETSVCNKMVKATSIPFNINPLPKADLCGKTLPVYNLILVGPYSCVINFLEHIEHISKQHT